MKRMELLLSNITYSLYLVTKDGKNVWCRLRSEFKRGDDG